MKTTDGHELSKYSHYYTRYGEAIVLVDWAQGQNEAIYLVRNYYEGETMSCAVYAGEHTEITAPFEAESEIVAVNEIFKDVPIFIIDEKYKIESEKVLALSLSIGVLDKTISSLTLSKNKMVTDISENESKLKAGENKLSSLNEEISSKTEKLQDITANISKCEDELGALESSESNVLVSKKELGNLRRTGFKMDCLEAGGVDNWVNYDDSLDAYAARYPD